MFYAHLEYVMAILCIYIWSFGDFVVIWYTLFLPVLANCVKKDLATLEPASVTFSDAAPEELDGLVGGRGSGVASKVFRDDHLGPIRRNRFGRNLWMNPRN
jgi:hypothetical protein